MVDSKENYKFDLGVKGLRNDHCDKVSLTLITTSLDFLSRECDHFILKQILIIRQLRNVLIAGHSVSSGYLWCEHQT